MMSIVKSPRYERDMMEIWHHIARHDPDAADRVLMAVEASIELLGSFPFMGIPCFHLDPGLRRTQWREYLIYYWPKPDCVEIARVLHGRRNITQREFRN